MQIILKLCGGGKTKKDNLNNDSENSVDPENNNDNENNLNNSDLNENENENPKFTDIIDIYNNIINQLDHFLKIRHNSISTDEEFLDIISKLNDDDIINQKNSDNQKIILTKTEYEKTFLN